MWCDRKIIFILLLSLGFTLTGLAQAALALTCGQVRHLTAFYFKFHYSLNSFDDEISRRTLKNIIQAWDPGKLYFLQADFDAFMEKYETRLDEMIAQGNCSAVEEVVNLYSQRFRERQSVILHLIDAKHDFTIDEYLVINRKQRPYATNLETINERWRKRIKFQLLRLKQTLNDMEKARQKLHKRYELAQKRHNERTRDDAYALFLNAFSVALDPHSRYFSAEQLEDFRISIRLSLEGIGAVLRSQDGITVIQSLVPGGAAWNTGKVKAADKILGVAQGTEPPVDIVDMALREVVKLIRGAQGTEVRLSILREENGQSKRLIVPIVREKIQLENRAAKSHVFDVHVKESPTTTRKLKIGLIDLPSFYIDFEGRQKKKKDYRSCSVDVIKHLEKLQKVGIDGLILDLRSNGGGSLDEAINVAGLFFDKGPVVQVKGLKGRPDVYADRDGKTYYSGPLAVMISKHSASASEIVAGAIQDYGRGLILGDNSTFGKGTVQNLHTITAKLGAIKVTTGAFYRPSGSSTQRKGVEADLVLPSVLNVSEIGERYYDYALPWERIKPSKFQKFSSTIPYLTALSQASHERLDQSPDFKKVEASIAKTTEASDERDRVSLKDKTAEDTQNAPATTAADKTTQQPANETSKRQQQDRESNGGQDRRRPGDEPPSLEKDFYLREALKITADYAQLLHQRQLGDITLPALDTNKIAIVGNEQGIPTSTAIELDTRQISGHDIESEQTPKAPKSPSRRTPVEQKIAPVQK